MRRIETKPAPHAMLYKNTKQLTCAFMAQIDACTFRYAFAAQRPSSAPVRRIETEPGRMRRPCRPACQGGGGSFAGRDCAASEPDAVCAVLVRHMPFKKRGWRALFGGSSAPDSRRPATHTFCARRACAFTPVPSPRQTMPAAGRRSAGRRAEKRSVHLPKRSCAALPASFAAIRFRSP